ncbi:MAG: CPBP family intramembrane metalloprotease [Caulobacteraceae bacterium]|nr:CPBP family intramembrane metalloprotease [Caulobacteraceae bacterium]
MTPSHLASDRPFFEAHGVRLRLWPLVVAALAMQACLVPAREAARWLFRSGPESLHDHVGLFVFLAIVLQGASGLLGIVLMRRLLPAADAHLRRPVRAAWLGQAALIGLAMGLIMLVVDYGGSIVARQAPGGYSHDPAIAAGWLLAMITTGLGEETIFRGLLVGMLVVLCPGRVRVGGFEIPVAGVLVALLFSAAHYDSFLHDPLAQAVGQQLYAFVWGLIYVWLMERSRSLAAPIVAHGVGNFTEVALVMILNSQWA